MSYTAGSMCLPFVKHLVLTLILTVRPGYSSPTRHLCGVKIGKATEILFRTVERGYGHAIHVMTVAGWADNKYGVSSIGSDGVPIIQLNERTGRTEDTIVHELMHLKMRLDGFTLLEFSVPSGTAPPANMGFLTFIGFHLRDPIEHFIFFDEMRKMSIDPSATLKVEFQKALRADRYPALDPHAPSYSTTLALYFLKASLQLSHDHALLERIRAWYISKGWNKELTVGERLAAILQDRQLTTPDDEDVAFVACMNLLLGDQGRFRSLGVSGTAPFRVTTIQVLPPQ